MNEAHVNMRVPKDLLKRIDRLIPKLAGKGDFAAFRVSRSAVLRLAIQRGVEALEKESRR